MDNVQIDRVFTADVEMVEAARAFMQSHDLQMELPVSLMLVARSEGTIVATGALQGQIIKMLAVDEKFRGTNLIGMLISELMGQAFQMGQDHLFVYTKPENASTFENLGFYEICSTDHVALFENRQNGIESYFKDVKNSIKCLGPIGAVVMNCNPFTLGHQYLIETAAKKVKHLIVFVLSEDLSTFPANVRLRLVQEGTAHISNVTVCTSGPYMVSSATFPSYFLKEGHDKVGIHTELDAVLFGSKIAKYFGITSRYLGEEPYSPTTEAYNNTLQKVLGRYGLHVEIIVRKSVGSEIVSASKVRRFIAEDLMERALELVPPTTGAYLLSSEAAAIIEKIKSQAHLARRI